MLRLKGSKFHCLCSKHHGISPGNLCIKTPSNPGKMALLLVSKGQTVSVACSTWDCWHSAPPYRLCLALAAQKKATDLSMNRSWCLLLINLCRACQISMGWWHLHPGDHVENEFFFKLTKANKESEDTLSVTHIHGTLSQHWSFLEDVDHWAHGKQDSSLLKQGCYCCSPPCFTCPVD